jgi:hypothetical protein
MRQQVPRTVALRWRVERQCSDTPDHERPRRTCVYTTSIHREQTFPFHLIAVRPPCFHFSPADGVSDACTSFNAEAAHCQLAVRPNRARCRERMNATGMSLDAIRMPLERVAVALPFGVILAITRVARRRRELQRPKRPRDIYAGAGTPCVAVHSTTAIRARGTP